MVLDGQICSVRKVTLALTLFGFSLTKAKGFNLCPAGRFLLHFRPYSTICFHAADLETLTNSMAVERSTNLDLLSLTEEGSQSNKLPKKVSFICEIKNYWGMKDGETEWKQVQKVSLIKPFFTVSLSKFTWLALITIQIRLHSLCFHK